ncbi:hypothetical protein GLX27_002821 [Malassezia furfur]|uniref:UDP-N-acetylglucosamine--peptide N-acetylglucosaminyltransferase SPINDLY n=1 Tax=Malassezia furfur TaxID=55194 RepID=A0ABY8EV52_MALFU|nr:hypothetical protein GLX27_002821 [Malassezia furfur]
MAVAVPQTMLRTPTRIAVQTYATEKDNSVSFNDPTEQEAQRFLELGTIALEVGDLEKAMEHYRKSLEVRENASAYYNLGVCQYQDQDLESAITSWNEALRLAPDSPDAHTNLASAYIMSKPSRPDLALEHLRTAASQSPDDAEIHFNLGAVLEACEELEEAIEAYKKAVQGGIERAEQNVRNCMAKIMSARLDVENQQKAGAAANDKS